MKLVYLHGVGDGDADLGWLEALNEGLATNDDSDVIAPSYSDILTSQDADQRIPWTTPREGKADVSGERAEFLSRQIEAARAVGADPSVQSIGFPLIDLDPSDAAFGLAGKVVPNKFLTKVIGQIGAYVH